MKQSKITKLSRIVLIICGFGLLTALFTPLWRIDLMAPQYPEGLRLLIHANGLAGNVEIINGLNHYIGMKVLNEIDFPEFKILPGIIVFFSLCFIIAGIAGKRKWMNILFIAFVFFGVVAMADFWRWEYDYGHNLDPNAAIIVPGMAYQPPLIGFKQLLNFGAWSVPDIGGWVFVGVGAILMALVIIEWRRKKKTRLYISKSTAILMCFIALSFASCNTDPQPIRMGKDVCDFCKMTISDERFGAEIVTQKRKIYKFDDAHCVLAFMKKGTVAKQDVAEIYFTNFNSPHELINVKEAHFLQSPSLKSPMNGNIAAFPSEESLTKIIPQFYGNIISWEDIQK